MCIIKAQVMLLITQQIHEWALNLSGLKYKGLPTGFPPRREGACRTAGGQRHSFTFRHDPLMVSRGRTPNGHVDTTPEPFPADACMHFFSKHVSWDS